MDCLSNRFQWVWNQSDITVPVSKYQVQHCTMNCAGIYLFYHKLYCNIEPDTESKKQYHRYWKTIIEHRPVMIDQNLKKYNLFKIKIIFKSQKVAF